MHHWKHASIQRWFLLSQWWAPGWVYCAIWAVMYQLPAANSRNVSLEYLSEITANKVVAKFACADEDYYHRNWIGLACAHSWRFHCGEKKNWTKTLQELDTVRQKKKVANTQVFRSLTGAPSSHCESAIYCVSSNDKKCKGLYEDFTNRF